MFPFTPPFSPPRKDGGAHPLSYQLPHREDDPVPHLSSTVKVTLLVEVLLPGVGEGEGNIPSLPLLPMVSK